MAPLIQLAPPLRFDNLSDFQALLILQALARRFFQKKWLTLKY
ncbi:hypothetical protein ACSZNH_22400 [Aeromonas dhakensis]